MESKLEDLLRDMCPALFMDDKYLSRAEVALFFGVTRMCIYNWEREGKFPSTDKWGKWKVSSLAKYFITNLDKLEKISINYNIDENEQIG